MAIMPIIPGMPIINFAKGASRTGNYETGGTGEAGGTSGKAGKQDIFLVFGR